MMPKREAAEYITVDLEVRSRFDLKPLSEALSSLGAHPLSLLLMGRTHFASFSQPYGRKAGPDAAILRFGKAIARLPTSLRSHWRRASDRVFDIGIEGTSGRVPLALEVLRPDTMKEIHKLGARIAITVYPPERKGKRR